MLAPHPAASTSWYGCRVAAAAAAAAAGFKDVLRRLYAIDAVSGTQATVVLQTFFERAVWPLLGEGGVPVATARGVGGPYAGGRRETSSKAEA